ncbi:MAG: glycosyltransferase [Sphingobacteriaceae bacterium]|nr:MAG: glycosyltransferase [Sphingobacteriaceae bacterium]
MPLPFVTGSKKLKIFTWHIHGTYLYYLSLGDYEIYIPKSKEAKSGYVGLGTTFPFGENVHEVDEDKVPQLELDVILFQTKKNYLQDQYETLSAAQRELPRIYLEHDPPQETTPYTKHIVTDRNVNLVHVTHFNSLLWDNNNLPFTVIEHGVEVRQVPYSGELERGIVVINNIEKRGRRLGLDVFLEVQKHVPIDLVGMGAERLGLGEVLHPQLPEFLSRYRFFFNPIRFTSLGLAVCEAMTMGIPVVGLATTELASVITNGKTGIIHTDINYLISAMKDLLSNPDKAKQIGAAGQEMAKKRFDIKRFNADWLRVFKMAISKKQSEKIAL